MVMRLSQVRILPPSPPLSFIGDIAQLGERQTVTALRDAAIGGKNLDVGGSTPSIPTTLWSLYSMCRHLAANVRSPGTLLLPAAGLRDSAAFSI